MTALVGGEVSADAPREKGPFGTLRARRRRNRTAPAPAARTLDPNQRKPLQRGRSAHMGVGIGESKRKSWFDSVPDSLASNTGQSLTFDYAIIGSG